MKDNLVWKIDVLEAKLRGEEGNTQLRRSKHVVAKYKKKVAALNDDDKVGLQNQIRALRKTLIERKVHHGTKIIQRAIKKVVIVESLKLKKKIAKSEGDAAKRKALNTEFNKLKSIPAPKMAQYLTKKTINEEILEKETDAGTDANEDDGGPVRVVNLLSPDFKNQLKLLTHLDLPQIILESQTVKKAQDEVILTLRIAAGEIKKPERSQEQADKNKKTKESENTTAEESNETSEDATDASKDDEDSQSDKEDEEEEDEHDEENKASEPKPSAAPYSGYVSGSDEEDDGPADYRDKPHQPHSSASEKKKRSRPPKHMRKKAQNYEIGSETSKPYSRPRRDNNNNKSTFDRQDRKAVREDSRTSGRKTDGATNKSSRPDQSSQKLHPSWEAKKKQKEMSNVKFEGKKKVFE